MAAPQRGGGGFPGRDLRVGEGSEVKLDEASASELPTSRPRGELPPMTRQAATDGGGPVGPCSALRCWSSACSITPKMARHGVLYCTAVP